MEEPPSPTSPNDTMKKNNSTVDTSRAFSSVKEAVAIFGEKLLAGELYSSPRPFAPPPPPIPTPKKDSPWKLSMDGDDDMYSSKSFPMQEGSPSFIKDMKDEQSLAGTLKRLESELEETKMELKLLKERESETEVALASLNAELHKNMSKIAQSEAMAAAKARTNSLKDEERKRDMIMKMEDSPTLSQILGLGEEKEGLFGERKRERKMMMKKKPIVPILTDLFSRKKGGSNASLHRSLFTSTHVYLN